MKFLLTLLGIAYLVSPWDCFPDFFLGVGWIDDLIVVGLLWWYLYVYRKRFPKGRHHKNQQRPYHQNGSYKEEKEAKDSGSSRAGSQFKSEKDPYEVLKVQPGATPREIREAYRILAGRYHPDKVTHLGEEFRQLAEVRFKEIQNAYDALKVK